MKVLVENELRRLHPHSLEAPSPEFLCEVGMLPNPISVVLRAKYAHDIKAVNQLKVLLASRIPRTWGLESEETCIAIDLAVHDGVTKAFCETCGGAGILAGDMPLEECHACEGSGLGLRNMAMGIPGHLGQCAQKLVKWVDEWEREGLRQLRCTREK